MMEIHNPATAKSDVHHWEHAWQSASLPAEIDLTKSTPEGYFFRLVDSVLKRSLGFRENEKRNFLELGCGASRWLSYLSNSFGFSVSGIDYSETGCATARALLSRSGITGEITLGDIFRPPSRFENSHDIVGSFGLIEHFDDTVAALVACAKFVRTGGKLVSMVPTMTGPLGIGIRMFRPDYFALHNPQSLSKLRAAHVRAGLKVIEAKYLLGLPVILSADDGSPSCAPRGQLGKLASAYSSAYVKLEANGFGLPANRLTSPYLLVVAEK
jgi:SAM-dependent methyltransferase